MDGIVRPVGEGDVIASPVTVRLHRLTGGS
ncbi:hypothetical protein ABH926_008759 [Catenulispora sp. GP43]